MIPGSANPLLLATAAAGGYTISRSLRFNSADSAYLSRTPASAGNRRTWTWAGWVKRSRTGADENIFSHVTSSVGQYVFTFNAGDAISFYIYTGSFLALKQTTQVFRDTSAWYHLQIVWDTTNATAADRMRLYVNGSRVTTFSSSVDPSLNLQGEINNIVEHGIGTNTPFKNTFFSGYLADIHFIDGQALDPTSFGEFSATTGVWMPKAFSGSYGTNGFHLEFADNSAATAAALGKDTSGNGNNFTPTNLSVTAGAGNDSLVDVPVNGSQTDTGVGGEVRGNYCTLNPLDAASGGTMSNGNLEWARGATVGFYNARSTVFPASGKYYWEVTVPTIIYGTSGCQLGLATSAMSLTANPNSTTVAYLYENAGVIYPAGNISGSGTQASFTTGDIIGFAFDRDANTLAFYKNGSLQPKSLISLPSNLAPFVGLYNDAVSGNAIFNFGQRPFVYTAPSGFKALCTANLPTGTITTSGTFTGNANADGPFVYLNGVPTAMTINGNAVTFATHADKLSNGFKVRTSSGSYNTAGSNTYSVSTTGANFKNARAQSNP